MILDGKTMILDCSGQSCAMADEWLKENRNIGELDSFVKWARIVHRIDLSEYVAWFREKNINSESEKIRKFDEIVKVLEERNPYTHNRETCNIIRQIAKGENDGQI